MIARAMMVVGLSSPGVVVSVLTGWVWQWGFRYVVFTLCFVYTTIYFLYWFLTDFWDNA